jgi:hypothetical protein
MGDTYLFVVKTGHVTTRLHSVSKGLRPLVTVVAGDVFWLVGVG